MCVVFFLHTSVYLWALMLLSASQKGLKLESNAPCQNSEGNEWILNLLKLLCWYASQFMAIASYKYMTWQRGSLYIYLYSIVKILKYSDRDCHSLFIKLINKLFIHQWQVQYNNNNNNMRFLSLLQNGQMEI